MKEKLLILDDERLILASLEHFFEDEYEVFTSTDAETALQLAQDHDIAIILSDERMPGVSGHEFLRRVREVSDATRVMMSGYADMMALTEAVNSGKIFAYISKPWEPLKLKAQIAAAGVHFGLMREIDTERGLVRALMENSPDLIYFKDRESRFTRVNQAAARDLGETDSAGCIGKSDLDYFESGAAHRWRMEEEEIVRSGAPAADRVEQRRNSSGQLRWASTTKVPMFDRNGQVSGIAGISRDITALKNSEEMLREQCEHNRMILDAASDAFIGMDLDGGVTAWNPQAESTFGWTAAEIIGRSFYDAVIAPVCRDGHVQGVQDFLKAAQGSQLNRSIELVAMNRDGREVPVEATVLSLRLRERRFPVSMPSYEISASGGAPRKFVSRRREEVELLQAVTVAANHSSTIEHTAQACLGLICSHLDWPVGHAYLWTNDAAVEPLPPGLLHVVPPGGFESFRQACDRCDAAPLPELLSAVLTSQKAEWMVNPGNKLPPPEGMRAATEAGLQSGFGFPVLVDSKIIAVLEFFSPQIVPPDYDLLTLIGGANRRPAWPGGHSPARRGGSSARQGRGGVGESREEREFLTTMSHEMRTPMNAILGMADLLSESSLLGEQRDYVHIFQKAGANLLHLINDILDLSRVESGHFELESIGFDLRALLEKISEMMASRAQDRGLQFTFEVLPGVPPGLVGDANRVQQILINLIGNALKFTDRGSVQLRVEPDPSGAAGWLRFSVIDTGIGIAANKMEIIFDRFTQADSSTTRRNTAERVSG